MTFGVDLEGCGLFQVPGLGLYCLFMPLLVCSLILDRFGVGTRSGWLGCFDLVVLN